MKELLSTIFILATTILSVAHAAHSLPMIDSKINYSEIVVVDGAMKDELYSKAKLWIANTFESSESLILDDKENGVIISKGSIQVKENEVGVRTAFNTKPLVEKTWTFTVKIQIKDGRCKVEMYDIEYTFAMPGNNVGHAPLPRNLDTLFLDKKMYKKNGDLKNGAPINIATWTNENFNALLASFKKALTEKVVLDDF